MVKPSAALGYTTPYKEAQLSRSGQVFNHHIDATFVLNVMNVETINERE